MFRCPIVPFETINENQIRAHSDRAGQALNLRTDRLNHNYFSLHIPLGWDRNMEQALYIVHVHCKKFWLTLTTFWLSQLHSFCVCDT